MRGKFITFEGCEGAGKTHQIKKLTKYLDDNKIEYIVTREPGGSKLSEKIRSLILSRENSEMTAECEALLYSAARVQHLTDIVEPALSLGKLVICDRYIDSSLAYQGYARGLGFEFIEKINSYALEKYMPDLTLFLDISPICAFERKGGADKSDRLEMSGIEFHSRVYEGYKRLLDMFPNRFKAINCLGTREQTSANIINMLKAHKII